MKNLSVFFIFLFFSCKQIGNEKSNEIILNKILVPNNIKWDTLVDGFGDNIDLLNKTFNVVYIDKEYIYKVETNNEIYESCILIVSSSSKVSKYKIVLMSENIITYSDQNNIVNKILIYNNKSVNLNNELFEVNDKICPESYDRFKDIIQPNKKNIPNEVNILR